MASSFVHTSSLSCGHGWNLGRQAMSTASARLEIATHNLANGSSAGFRRIRARGSLDPLGAPIESQSDAAQGALRRAWRAIAKLQPIVLRALTFWEPSRAVALRIGPPTYRRPRRQLQRRGDPFIGAGPNRSVFRQQSQTKGGRSRLAVDGFSHDLTVIGLRCFTTRILGMCYFPAAAVADEQNAGDR